MKSLKPNVLGDLRAEHDHNMLEHAYYDTPDFKSLLEHDQYQVVVGRRGVGKSAMCYRLHRLWSSIPHLHLALLCPEEHQVIGLRPLIGVFHQKPTLIHAAARIVWRYALMLEATALVWGHYKFRSVDGDGLLKIHVGKWLSCGNDFAERLRNRLLPLLTSSESLEAQIADLPGKLEINEVQTAIQAGLQSSKEKIVLLIDRLDEGYEPDEVGVGLLIGLVHAAIDLNTRFPEIRTILFLRDNISRAISQVDPNYSRNVEGHVLRLHWDEYHLFNMVANRFRRAFDLTQESSIKVWNAVAADDLSGKDGFKKCLKHTLYRPRDILSLLNQTFYQASRCNRSRPVYSDVEAVAKEISKGRLSDLIKEYEAVFPGLDRCVEAFAGRDPTIKVSEAQEILSVVLAAEDSRLQVRQHFAILNQPSDIIKSLHSIGFLGVQDHKTKTYVFCHDGRSDPLELSPEKLLFIHPCYWLALNCVQIELPTETAVEIHDEYDIEVSSETPEIRNHRLGQLINGLSAIKPGHDSAGDFEEWCAQALRVIFASSLRNIELKPNRQSVQRRDIVATNHGQTPAWKRILEDYGVRQVIFEVKNYSTPLDGDEYRQVLSYLTREYGKLGFIITQHPDDSLEKGQELDWMREMHHSHGALIVKITAKTLARLLSKLRSPQKHDAADEWLDGLLDKYVRNYLSLPTTRKRKR